MRMIVLTSAAALGLVSVIAGTATAQVPFHALQQRILARIAQKQACVQAATNREGLRACFPRAGRRTQPPRPPAPGGAPQG